MKNIISLPECEANDINVEPVLHVYITNKSYHMISNTRSYGND